MARAGINGWALCLLLAGVIIAFAATMPWASALFVSIDALDAGYGGALAVALGLLVGVPALLQLTGDGLGMGSRALAFLGGIGAIGLAMLAWIEVLSLQRTNPDSFLNLGAGVYIAGIGGGLAVVVAVMAPKHRRTE